MSDFKGRRFQCRILFDHRAADHRPADITSPLTTIDPALLIEIDPLTCFLLTLSR